MCSSDLFKPAAGHAVVAVSGRGRFAGVGAYGHQGDGRRDPDAAAIGPAYPVSEISPLQFASFVAGSAGIAEVAVMVAVGCVLALLRRLLMPLQLQGELGRQGQLRQRGRWRWRLRWRGGRGWRGAAVGLRRGGQRERRGDGRTDLHGGSSHG